MAAALVLAGLTVAALVTRDRFDIVLFALAVPVALTAVHKPLVGLLAAALMTQTYNWVTIGPDVSVFQLLVVAAAVGLVVQQRRALLGVVRSALATKVGWWSTALVGWVVLAAVVQAGQVQNLGYLRSFLGAFMVLLVVVATSLHDKRAPMLVLGMVVVGGLASAIVGFGQLVSTDALVSAWVLPALHIFQVDYDRFVSPWGLGAVGSNFSKDVLVALFLALPFLGTVRGTWARYGYFVVVGALALALVVSGSRSAWLAGMAGCAMAVFLCRSWRVTAVAGCLLVVLAACVARPALPGDAQRVVALERSPVEGRAHVAAPAWPALAMLPLASSVAGQRDQESTDASNNLRVRLLKTSSAVIARNPVFGVGAGAFSEQAFFYAPDPKPGEVIDPRADVPTHNVALEIWVDSGTPAFLAYVALVLALFVSLERSRRRQGGRASPLIVAVELAFTALVITSLFHNYQTENLFWILAGLAVAFELNPDRGRAAVT